MAHQIIIVGAGLFGSILARMARDKGFSVVLIDSGEQYRASRCAGALLKLEWSGMSPDDFHNAMNRLRLLFPARIRPHQAFNERGNPVLFETLAPEHVLMEPDVTEAVLSVEESGRVVTHGGKVFTGLVYCAAGVWTRSFFPHVDVRGGAGSALICKPQFPEIPTASVETWAPYKQAVSFKREDEYFWFGDGTSIKPDNYSRFYREGTKMRALASGLKDVAEMVGCRPFIANEGRRAGYYERLSDRCVIATGGAKVGMLLAPLFASRFLREMTV